jgi:putative ABC transport system ATP-binding protein
MSIFVELNRKGQTIVLVTHEHDIAEYSRRQVHLHDGIIAKDFLTEEIGAPA